MSGCTKHGHQYDCAACVREQFAETLAEASIKRLKLANRIEEQSAKLEAAAKQIAEWRRRATELHHSRFCHVKTKACVRQRAHAGSDILREVAEELEGAMNTTTGNE